MDTLRQKDLARRFVKIQAHYRNTHDTNGQRLSKGPRAARVHTTPARSKTSMNGLVRKKIVGGQATM